MISPDATERTAITPNRGPGKREAKILKEGLRRNLVAYTLAGAGIAALSPEAAAEIVYTQVYRTFHGSGSGTMPIDLDNDGSTDFYLSWSANGGVGNASEWIRPANPGNKVITTGIEYRPPFSSTLLAAPAPLRYGALIGPGPGNKFAAGGLMGWGYGCPWRGPWVGKNGRYLGLEFQKNGAGHFGWARVTVGPCGTMALTGYAYETTWGKSLFAGQTKASVDSGSLRPGHPTPTTPSAQPATLGLLAKGASGLVAWRREDELLSSDV